MQRTAQVAFLLAGYCLLQSRELWQRVLVMFIFISGVFCVVSRLIASAVRAAADWRRWVLVLVLRVGNTGHRQIPGAGVQETRSGRN